MAISCTSALMFKKPHMLRLTTFFVALATIFCAKSVAQSGIESEKPRLVVGIVVEQMRYDYLNRFWKQLGNNGFKRLVREGSSFENAYHNTFFTQSSSEIGRAHV